MRRHVIPALMAATLVVAGCGDSSSDDADEPPATEPVGTAPPNSEPSATEPPATDAPAAPEAPAATDAPSNGSDGDPSAVTSVCDLLTADDLRNNPFFVDEPIAEGTDFGEGFLECVWTGEFEPHEVRVSFIPLESWESDFAAAQPVDLHGVDIGDGLLYDDLLGIGRVGSGTTVVHLVGDVAILTAVRTGEDGSSAADRPFAADLAQRVLDRI